MGTEVLAMMFAAIVVLIDSYGSTGDSTVKVVWIASMIIIIYKKDPFIQIHSITDMKSSICNIHYSSFTTAAIVSIFC